MEQDHNKRVERILQSIDTLHKAAAPDFFYTRLRARMEKEIVKAPGSTFLLGPAFLTACLALVFAFNCLTLLFNNHHPSEASGKPANIENFASDYNLNTESVY